MFYNRATGHSTHELLRRKVNAARRPSKRTWIEPMNSAFALAFTNASLGRISLKLLSEMSGGIIQCSGDGRSQIMVIQTQ